MIRYLTTSSLVGIATLIVAGPRPPRDASRDSRSPTLHASRDATVNYAVAHDVSAPLSSLARVPNLGIYTPADAKQPIRSITTGVTGRAAAADVEQRHQGTRAPATLVESFDGLGVGFTGPQGTARASNPSDNSLAVGPDHIVQIVNSRMAIYTRKGKKYNVTGRALYGAVATNNVFKGFTGNCEARSSGDAVARYDQLADRWLIVLPLFSRGPVRPDQPVGTRPNDPAAVSVIGVAGQPGKAATLFQPPPPPPPAPAPAAAPAPAPGAPPATPPARGTGAGNGRGAAQGPQGPYSMCYALSVSSDPMGAYYRYEFLRAYFPDYPRPAVWPDGYYIPTSTSDNRIAPTVATQKHACVADRVHMLKGEPATEQCVIVENVNFLNNVDLDGKKLPPKGAPNLMLAAGGRQLDSIFADSVINVWQFHVDWANPANTRVSGPQVVPVAPYNYLCNGQLTNCVPQSGTERRLDSQGDKLMARVVYRRIGNTESIVATHSINTSNGAGGVRWYEFRVGKDRNVALHQQGTYAPDGMYRWLPSPAMDKNGSIGIGYSYGGASVFPGQRFAGRLAKDPLGVLTLQEHVMANGEAPQTTTLRWEDYSQTAVDPRDDCTIWYVGDYLRKDATSYTSRIAAYRMPGCK